MIQFIDLWTVGDLLWSSQLESTETNRYIQLSIQDLCAELNQEDAVEIQAILEVILSRLLLEVTSTSEKKNVCFSRFPSYV